MKRARKITAVNIDDENKNVTKIDIYTKQKNMDYRLATETTNDGTFWLLMHPKPISRVFDLVTKKRRENSKHIKLAIFRTKAKKNHIKQQQQQQQKELNALS